MRSPRCPDLFCWPRRRRRRASTRTSPSSRLIIRRAEHGSEPRRGEMLRRGCAEEVARPMIKWLIIIIVLAVGGYFAYLYMHPEKRACARLVSDLCHKSSDSTDDARAKCEEAFHTVRDKAGNEAAANSAKCISDSDNCAGALGCV